jgi:hypothetical protein
MQTCGTIVRLALGALLAWAITLPLATSAAMALEVAKNGTFLQKQCGSSAQGAGPGCSWCTSRNCYIVTDCNGKTCNINRSKNPNPAIAHAPNRPINRIGGTQTKAVVEAQQPPPVWSGSTRPIEGNQTHKGGPVH